MEQLEKDRGELKLEMDERKEGEGERKSERKGEVEGGGWDGSMMIQMRRYVCLHLYSVDSYL